MSAEVDRLPPLWLPLSIAALTVLAGVAGLAMIWGAM